MPFKVFKILFPKSLLAAHHKNKFSHIKTYNQSDIKQLGVCTVRLGPKDKYAKCRFF